MPSLAQIIREKTQRAKAQVTKKKRQQQIRRNNRTKAYLTKIQNRSFSAMNASDLETFYRSYYKFRLGSYPIREDYGMSLKIWKNLIEDYGAAKAMDIITASFESSRVPKSVKYFGNAICINCILEEPCFANLKKDSLPFVNEWFKVESEREVGE